MDNFFGITFLDKIYPNQKKILFSSQIISIKSLLKTFCYCVWKVYYVLFFYFLGLIRSTQQAEEVAGQDQ